MINFMPRLWRYHRLRIKLSKLEKIFSEDIFESPPISPADNGESENAIPLPEAIDSPNDAEPDDDYDESWDLSFDDPDTTLEDLDFSVRTHMCLKRAKILTLGEITQHSEEWLLKNVRNLGSLSIKEITEKLNELGLSLAETQAELPEDVEALQQGDGQILLFPFRRSHFPFDEPS